MPVTVGDLSFGGDHAIIANTNAVGSTDAYAGRNQTVIANINFPLLLLARPCADTHGFMTFADDMQVITRMNMLASDAERAGVVEKRMVAQGIKLWSNNAPDI